MEVAQTNTLDVVNQVRQTIAASIEAVDTAINASTENLATTIDSHLARTETQVTRIQRLMTEVRDATANLNTPVLDAVANSYRTWLSGGGMNLMLDQMTQHFANAPTGADGATPAVLEGFTAADGRHDVVVRVDEVVIEIQPAAEPELGAVGSSPTERLSRSRRVGTGALNRRAIARGGNPGDLDPIGVG